MHAYVHMSIGMCVHAYPKLSSEQKMKLSVLKSYFPKVFDVSVRSQVGKIHLKNMK